MSEGYEYSSLPGGSSASSPSWRRLAAVASLLFGALVMVWKLQSAMNDNEGSDISALQRFFHVHDNKVRHLLRVRSLSTEEEELSFYSSAELIDIAGR
jgi:hypothetical protein